MEYFKQSSAYLRLTPVSDAFLPRGLGIVGGNDR